MSIKDSYITTKSIYLFLRSPESKWQRKKNIFTYRSLGLIGFCLFLKGIKTFLKFWFYLFHFLAPEFLFGIQLIHCLYIVFLVPFSLCAWLSFAHGFLCTWLLCILKPVDLKFLSMKFKDYTSSIMVFVNLGFFFWMSHISCFFVCFCVFFFYCKLDMWII